MTTNQKVLTFTAATGGGHYSASKAFLSYLQEAGFDAKICDVFIESNRFMNFMICGLYKDSVYYFPKGFQLCYDLGNHIPLYNSRAHNTFVKANCQNLIKLINREKPDLIVSIHPYGTILLGVLKRDGYFNIPMVSILTDYKFHQFYYNDQVDACIVGNEYAKATMVQRGIDPDVIYPYGIPVRKEFTAFDPQKKPETASLTALVMGGHLGEKHMLSTVSALLKVQRNLELIIVCGNNQRLKRMIERRIAQHPESSVKAEIFGYVENVYDLMDRSDLIITKPGGLTVTEALNKRLPLLIPYCYPAQEMENRDYLVEYGMAMRIDRTGLLTELMTRLYDDRRILGRMREKIDQNMQCYSMEKAVELCRNLCGNC